MRNEKGQFIKGIKYQLGYKHTDETKKKIREARAKQGSNVWNKDKKGYKTKPCSEERKRKIGEAQMGEKNHMWGKRSPNYKGGITPLELQIRHHFKSRQWRCDIFTRDDYTCQECFIRGKYLEAHHIKRFSKIILENNIKTIEEALNCEELWNINNGRTLCENCHKKFNGRNSYE